MHLRWKSLIRQEQDPQQYTLETELGLASLSLLGSPESYNLKRAEFNRRVCPCMLAFTDNLFPETVLVLCSDCHWALTGEGPTFVRYGDFFFHYLFRIFQVTANQNCVWVSLGLLIEKDEILGEQTTPQCCVQPLVTGSVSHGVGNSMLCSTEKYQTWCNLELIFCTCKKKS